MNSKRLLTLLLSLAMSPVGLYADDAAPYQPSLNQNVSMPVEAFKATFGRVFGAQDQGADIAYHVVDMTGQTRINSATRSALVPGWGQSFNGQQKKGKILFGTFAAAAIGSFVLHETSKDSYDDYKASGRVNDSHYNDYTRKRTHSVILGSGAAALWLYSIFDASRNAYSRRLSRASEFELAYLPHGGEVFWRKKF